MIEQCTKPRRWARLLAVAAVIFATTHATSTGAASPAYAGPSKAVLVNANMRLDLERTALVVIDPQIDFMSPKGAGWPVVGESVTEQHTVPNLVRLFEAAKRAGIVVAISPHYYYPYD